MVRRGGYIHLTNDEVTVPNGPLLKWIRELGVTPSAAASGVGVTDKWMRGSDGEGRPTQEIPLHVVDRILTHYGTPLWAVYPELGPDWDSPAHEVILAWCPQCMEEDPTHERYSLRGTMVVPADDGTCMWCGTQTGGAEVPRANIRLRSKVGMTIELLHEARSLYLTGLSFRDVSERLIGRTTYVHPRAMANALYRNFRTLGWPARDARISSGATHYRHGKHDDAAFQYERRFGHQPRCEGIKMDTVGRRCKLPAAKGSRFCRFHDPEKRGEVLAYIARYEDNQFKQAA